MRELRTARAAGKALRATLPRAAQGPWAPSPDRPDPIPALAHAVRERDPDLLPYRWGRMAQSPFYFFRGNAALMAADIARLPVTGLECQLCGDAHLLNQGAYAGPDGNPVFDLNDFDEACRGPFEWDLKRLSASLVLAGREAGHAESGCADAVLACGAAYRRGLHHLAELGVVERALAGAGPDHAPLPALFEKAHRDTPARLVEKAIHEGRFKQKGYGLRPLSDVEAAPFRAALGDYARSLPAGRRMALEGFEVVAFGQRVSGCGSLGVQDILAYALGSDDTDALFLEFKAQHGSVWAPYLPPDPEPHAGRRVAEAQQRAQTWTDPFLGWATVAGRAFLVKQWSDHKASLELADLAGATFGSYAALCGSVLAKAQARSGRARALAGYVGHADELDQALAEFARTYADQCTRDWETFKAAIRAGRLEARSPD